MYGHVIRWGSLSGALLPVTIDNLRLRDSRASGYSVIGCKVIRVHHNDALCARKRNAGGRK